MNYSRCSVAVNIKISSKLRLLWGFPTKILQSSFLFFVTPSANFIQLVWQPLKYVFIYYLLTSQGSALSQLMADVNCKEMVAFCVYRQLYRTKRRNVRTPRLGKQIYNFQVIRDLVGKNNSSVANCTVWSKSLCAPDEQPPHKWWVEDRHHRIHSECGPCCTLREHSSACQ
jgi:hypothetical protein